MKFRVQQKSNRATAERVCCVPAFFFSAAEAQSFNHVVPDPDHAHISFMAKIESGDEGTTLKPSSVAESDTLFKSQT